MKGDRVKHLEKDLEGMSYNHINHEGITRELIAHRLSPTPWYKRPELWVSLVAAIASCIAAYATLFPPRQTSSPESTPATNTSIGKSLADPGLSTPAANQPAINQETPSPNPVP